MDTRTGGQLIRSGLPRALALSVLAHLLVLSALPMTPVEPPDPAARPPVQLRLQRAPAPTPAPKPRPPQPESAPSPAQTPPSPGISARNPESGRPEPGRWMETAREVIRSVNPDASPFLAPELSYPSLGESARFRMPKLEAAFRPLPRPVEMCGRMVTFNNGPREVSLLVAYPCEGEQDEHGAPPGNATSADSLRDNADSRP